MSILGPFYISTRPGTHWLVNSTLLGPKLQGVLLNLSLLKCRYFSHFWPTFKILRILPLHKSRLAVEIWRWNKFSVHFCFIIFCIITSNKIKDKRIPLNEMFYVQIKCKISRFYIITFVSNSPCNHSTFYIITFVSNSPCNHSTFNIIINQLHSYLDT